MKKPNPIPKKSNSASSSSKRKSGGVKTEPNSKEKERELSNEWNSLNLHELIWRTVLKCDVDIRRELLNNMILVGGGSLIDGLSPRLVEELSRIAPSSMKIKAPVSGVSVEKHHAAWVGGSILSICGSFQQLWISKQEYDEYGPTVYQRKSQH